MKSFGFCMLLVLLSMVPGRIWAASSTSGLPPSQARESPSSPANPPLPQRPARKTVPDVPHGSPRNPDSKPMQVPAPTEQYGGLQGFPRLMFLSDTGNKGRPWTI